MVVAIATAMALPSSTSVSSTPTSVADRVAHAFTPHAMVQGFASHGKGVETLTSTSDRFLARVRSKRTHDVSLRAGSDRLVIACSCPARSLGLSGCKHAWAALLEVDRCGGLTNLRRERSSLTVEMSDLDAERPASAKEKSAEASPRARPGVAKTAAGRAARDTPKAEPVKSKAEPAKSKAEPAKSKATAKETFKRRAAKARAKA